jgi:hypothetical protein
VIVIVLVIFLKNVPIRKRKGVNKMIQIENKHTKTKELKRKISRKAFAPKKIRPDQTKMRSVKVILKGFYSWK